MPFDIFADNVGASVQWLQVTHRSAASQSWRALEMADGVLLWFQKEAED